MATSATRNLGRWSLITAAFTALLLALTMTPAASAATSTSSYCGITWGSLAKTATASSNPGTVQDLRAGRHDCYDRLVIDLGSSNDIDFDVRYVTQVVQDGSGLPISLRGGADLRILVQANAYDNVGPTFTPAVPAEAVAVTGFTTFRQVAWAGSFEGQSTIGLGVRARLPFRAFLLDGPGSGSRLVIDVAHRW